MDTIKDLDTEALLDLLSKYNAEYAKLMLTGSKEEFELCKSLINSIQGELHFRKQISDD
jgi:hypothetical protein